MAYNAAPILYGDQAPIAALAAANGRAQAFTDSLGVNLNTIYARIFWATAMCMSTWNGRVGLVDMSSRLLGANGAYEIGTGDKSNQYGLCQAQFSISGTSGASGERDVPGLWAINEDQATVNGGYDAGGGADFAHYTLGRNHPFGIHGGATPTGTDNEYFRQQFKVGSSWDTYSLNKLVGASGKVALRYLLVSPNGGSTADNIVRRIIDVGDIAVGGSTALGNWPTFRLGGGSTWKPGPGNALDAAGGSATMGGVLNAYRGDSADASGRINAMGDFILSVRDGDNDFSVALRGSSPIGSGRWQCAFGGSVYAIDGSDNFEGGKQIGSWGTNSASYNDIGGTGTGKNVSEARIARGLHLTAVSLSVPLVNFYQFGDEGGSTQSNVEAMAQVVQSAAETAGYASGDIHHIIATNHWRDCGQGSEAANSAYVEASRTAHRAAVDTLRGLGISCVNLSYYDATDGVPLNGGSAAIAYMAGYGAFEWGDGQVADLTGGNLLVSGGHPSANGSPFYATKGIEAMLAWINAGGGGNPSRAWAKKLIVTGVL